MGEILYEKILIIQGGGRANGNTAQLINSFQNMMKALSL